MAPRREISPPQNDGRSGFLKRHCQMARKVAAVGFWKAPPGPLVYWGINTSNWKIYIGGTINFPRRVRDHWNEAANGAAKPPLYNAMRKYEGFFVFVPVEYFETEAAMKVAETKAIAQYRAQDPEIGYNVADGGDGIGSNGARSVHARPDYKAKFHASYPDRALKAAETRRRNLAAKDRTVLSMSQHATDEPRRTQSVVVARQPSLFESVLCLKIRDPAARDRLVADAMRKTGGNREAAIQRVLDDLHRDNKRR